MILDKIRSSLPMRDASSDQLLVGLDIGTEFVKALIARIEGDTLEVIGVGRARQDLSDMHAPRPKNKPEFKAKRLLSVSPAS
jgi:sugar (pentulose or hexulose) kinase